MDRNSTLHNLQQKQCKLQDQIHNQWSNPSNHAAAKDVTDLNDINVTRKSLGLSPASINGFSLLIPDE